MKDSVTSIRPYFCGVWTFLVCVGLIWLLGLFLNFNPLPPQSSWLLTLSVMQRYLIDALIILALIIALGGNALWLRAGAWLVGTLGLFGFYVQYQSVRYSGDLFPEVALENVEHVAMIDNQHMLVGGLALLIYLIFSLVCVTQCKRSWPLGRRLILSALIVLLAVLFRNDHKWLPAETVTQRITLHNSAKYRHYAESPLGDLVDVLWHHFQLRYTDAPSVMESLRLNARLSEFVYKHNLHWGKEDPNYPLVHLAETEITDGLSSRPFPKPPNLIVIYAEGLSARTIQPYSDRFPGISPNIADFASESILIDYYFNHTFATYRGLSGQQCSLYPANRTEPATGYRCLPHILNDSGYQSTLLFSQRKADTELDEMAARIGFQSSLAYDELNTPFEDDLAHRFTVTHMSDLELFLGLNRELKRRESSSNQPFYLSLYSFETHTGNHLLDPEFKYRPTDNSEPHYILDTIHAFDAAFGQFWQAFKQSPLRDNTIVILTSDHAHFPDNDYRALWRKQDRYSPVFMDRIPLLIYSPFHTQTGKFTIRRSSSLDFAPSVLHLLGINRYVSTFLGHSLFDPTPRMRPLTMSNSDAWYAARGLPSQLTDEEPNPNYRSMQLFIKQTQALELNNRLWPTNTKK